MEWSRLLKQSASQARFAAIRFLPSIINVNAKFTCAQKNCSNITKLSELCEVYSAITLKFELGDLEPPIFFPNDCYKHGRLRTVLSRKAYFLCLSLAVFLEHAWRSAKFEFVAEASIITFIELYFECILLFNSRCLTLCHSNGGTIGLTYDYERLLFHHHASLPKGNSMQNFMSEFPKQCESKESLCEMCSFRNNLTETRLRGENLDSDVNLH